MPILQVPPVLLLAPAFLIGALIGYRRGWQREAITALCLMVALVLLWNGPTVLIGAINWVLERLGRVLRVLTGSDPRREFVPLTLDPRLEPVVTLALLVGLAVVAYLVANQLGARYSVDRTGRWYGAIVGGLSLFILMSRAVGMLSQGGASPAGISGLNIQVPAFPGLLIVVPPPPDSALLVGWPLAALVVLVVSVMVFALLRVARA